MTRRTLTTTVNAEGIGIHTGAPSHVTILPAEPGSGIVFRAGGIEIPAHPQNVIDTSRCTILGKDGVTISTVEHLMSTFVGLGITDALVEVEGPELPIGDGGANIWIETIGDNTATFESPSAGAPKLPGEILVVGKHGSFITARPAATFQITVAAVFDHPLIGTQIARFGEGMDYATEVAPARTFGMIEEVEALRKAGLALGGSEDNAVVVYPDRYSRPLRFENELARHKLLDVLGDMGLAGVPLPNLEVFAVKPSHRLNVEFAMKLV